MYLRATHPRKTIKIFNKHLNLKLRGLMLSKYKSDICCPVDEKNPFIPKMANQIIEMLMKSNSYFAKKEREGVEFI